MAGLVYKWRIGNCKNAYLTDENGGDPFITVDIKDEDEEKISLVVKDFTEEEYKSKYELMCDIIANDPDGKNMVMLDYKYYYNIDETSCGLLQYGSGKGEQGPQGVGIDHIDITSGTTYTRLRIYLTDDRSYKVDIPHGINGINGINGSDGSDGSDGEHRNVVIELETQKEEIDKIRQEILEAARKELNEKFQLSQDALNEFARELSGLTHSIGSATTLVDSVIGLEKKINLFINYSAMTKTEFNNTINPYSGFMETVGLHVDAISGTVTYYGNKIDLANSQLKEAMSYYDQTANQLNEYWRKYDAVNNRLESVVAELTGNSTVSLSEIYQTAKEVGLMVTGDKTDVNGNPIMAAIIAQINDTGSTITLDATKIYMLGETVASALTTINLDINGGYSHFSADGSGWIANHGIEWNKNGDMTIKGQLTIAEVVEELGEDNVVLGKHTEARTIFSKDGSGSLAGGNIYWDKYGMLTIKKDVNIEGKLSVDEIADSLGHKIISFGKENGNATTYFYPDGSGSLAGGSISWDTDGSIKIAGDLTVGGSIVQEVVDQLDGENVSLGGGGANFNGQTGSGSLAGGLITWKRNNDGTASMKISGDVTIGDSTSGDTVDGVIAALNTSDISIGGGKTYFGKDGSGWLADKSISWDSGGTVTISNKCIIEGAFNATTGKIGLFNIDKQGIYSGEPNKWTDSSIKQNMAYFTPSILRLQQQYSYAGMNFANLKVGIGAYADPTHASNQEFCDSAAYFYRQMNNATDIYYPAVKIISDNVVDRNIALYIEGGVINTNGSLNNAWVMDADSYTMINFEKSDTQIIKNNTYRFVWLPSPSEMQRIMGVGNFAVTLTVIAHTSNTQNFVLAFQEGQTNMGWRDYDGKGWNKSIDYTDKNGNKQTNDYCRVMGKGDIVRFVLIYEDPLYWAQLLEYHS